ncbi:MAG: hypothetical protein M5U01_31060 [Ardenticatenaceae bacterium]|nr:hypothetical protein [Ardenticatenaceae bacterium]HBY99309.1 hypothetical protein [Chloroflexota bacterium]
MNPGSLNVLIADPVHEDGVALLRQHATVDIRPGLSRSELEQIIGNYDALIVRGTTKVPASVINYGHRLRVIARAGAGLDNIDVSAARVQGVEVVNSPDANTIAVAEHTLALMLALARRLIAADQSMKAGRWEKSQSMGSDLSGRTLGIIGFGRIGRQVAKRAQAFGMRVIVNQPRLTPELALEWGVEQRDLPDLLRESDFVTLHVPMRPETEGLIGANELALMKPTAYLINTARGGVVDEPALLTALEEGRLAGAGLDVFEHEPNVDSALAGHPKVVATPHIGASTEDAQRAAALSVVEQVLAVLRRQRASETLALKIVPLEKVVPHEAFDPRRVADLAARLEEEGRLVNPPVVAEWGDHYVVLDGATRTTALKQLNFPHTIVQVVSPEEDEGVQLHTWYHAISGGEVSSLLKTLQHVPGLKLTAVPVDHIQEAMRARNALAYLLTADNRGFLLEVAPDAEGDWLDVLNATVNCYTGWGRVERTLVTDRDVLRAQYPEMVALVVFPQFTPESVLRIATEGRVMPAGITRFVIPGRVLRLNAPLQRLRADEPLGAKSAWLDHLVQEKLARRRVRYYQEPVVLLDE